MSAAAPRGALTLQREEEPALVREVVTPEGIPVRFVLARAGDRAGAFAFDLMFQLVALILVGVVLQWAVGLSSGSLLTAIYIVLAFLLLNFYFAFFEIRWQGATPGKRRLGLRVVDARGGQLEAAAVLARNLIRELEVWMPARFLLGGGLLWPGAPGWAKLLAGVWLFVFLLFPLLNKDRLRIGDLIAGTRVVVQPKVLLVPDLVDEHVQRAGAGTVTAPAYAFTEPQLSVYGIYELQVLEDLLRKDPGAPGHFDALATVAAKIHAKIKYGEPIRDTERFLRDFYAALRAHLEKRMLFGQRRADKYARP